MPTAARKISARSGFSGRQLHSPNVAAQTLTTISGRPTPVLAGSSLLPEEQRKGSDTSKRRARFSKTSSPTTRKGVAREIRVDQEFLQPMLPAFRKTSRRFLWG